MKGNRTWGIIMMVALVVVLVGCAGPPPALPATPTPIPAVKETPTPTPIKVERVTVGVPSKSATMGAFYMGKDKGFFRDEGIDLDIIVIVTALATASVVAGDLDYVASASTAFTAAAQGAPVRVIMATTTGGIWALIGSRGVNTPQDLKGKPVGMSARGTSLEYVVRESLTRLGLDPDKDATMVVISGGAPQLVALRAGAAGAIAMPPPWNNQAKEEGFKELIHTADVVSFPSNGLGASTVRLKQNPDQVRRLLRATLKSQVYMRDHRDETIDYFAKEFGLEKKVAQSSYDDVMKITIFDGNISEVGEKELIKMARFQGIKGDFDTKKIIDLSILKTAQRELGITR